MNRSILAAFVVPFLFVAVYAQPQAQQAPPLDEKSIAENRERRMALIEEISADVAGLRLAENRAFVLARSGSLICKDDKKAAQGFFQRSISELTNAQLSAEAEDRGKPNSVSLQLARNTRPNILTIIGGCDGELALDALYRTRTPIILRELAAQPDTAAKIGDSNSPGAELARTELDLEQRLTRLASEQNPEIAAKSLQDSIKKGLSGETLGLLKRLYSKDADAAMSLAAEAMDKLLSTNFSVDGSERNSIALAASILNDNLRVRRPGVKELTFEDLQLRSLAAKYVSFTIAQSGRFPMAGNFTQAIRFAEKFAPASVAALRKMQRDRMPPGAMGMSAEPEVRRVLDSKLTPAQVLAEARKLPAESRGPLFQNAAIKMATAGDYNGAVATLNANFTGRALDNALNNLNWNFANALMSQGKWQEAENLIDQFPEDNRRSALIELAKKAFAKDRETNRDLAASVLKKVRSQLPDRPADQLSLAQFYQLAAAFAPIEADEAFNTYELVIPVMNELADANAVVSGFRSDSSVRSGEYVISTPANFGFNVDSTVIAALAKADAARTSKLLDRFTRREIKIALRFQIAEPERRTSP